jgi:hypothetical protein
MVLYTDREDRGCRRLPGENSVQFYRGSQNQPSGSASALSVPAVPHVDVEPPHTTVPKLHARPFAEATRNVPVLMVYDLPYAVAEKGFYLASRGDIAIVDLRIAHLADGSGPRVSTDQHFRDTSRLSLEMAVEAAAKAVGYDSQYLDVRLSVQTVFLQNMLAIDGPSAGAVWAVAVASAILGDSIRPEVCMSGAISRNLEVQQVGGLEEKIKGCRLLNYREMIIPSGQVSTDLLFKGKGYEIKLTEVRMLAEAYAVATGRPLRPAE